MAEKLTVQLATFQNQWYRPGAGKLKQLLWYFCNLLFFLNPMNPFSGFKVFVLRLFGAKVGQGVVIKPAVNIKYPWLLRIGNHCWIGEKVWIDNLVQVQLGNNVCLSQGAMLLTGNHDYRKESFDLLTGEIDLADGVWIGAKAVVCPGINCASHSVLAVGSVATKPLEAYTIYQGNPALPVRIRKMEG